MIPIFVVPERDLHRAYFQCPIPKVNDTVVTRMDFDTLHSDIMDLAKNLNERVLNYEEPFDRFEGIYTLKEYDTIWLDDLTYHIKEGRGLTGAICGRTSQSGDIYRSDDGMIILSHVPYFVSKLCDEEEGFFCHNVDTYTQATVTRELCIQYFNYILRMKEELERL